MRSRQIKFRAWHKNFQIMLEVNNINFDHDEITGTHKDGGTRIICYENTFILMQSTGLTDKNGLEIYEGDILKWIQGHRNYNFDITFLGSRGIVFFDTPSFKALFKIEDDKKVIVLANYFSQSLEIIGNIHEHPHLLEKL